MLSKVVALCIIKARICSEAGKYQTDTLDAVCALDGHTWLWKKVARQRYNAKEHYIVKAIETINRNKNCGFYYSVTTALTNNDRESLLIYFNFKLDGVRHQVSFHTFGFDKLGKYVNHNCNTRWLKDKEKNASVKLFDYLFCA